MSKPHDEFTAAFDKFLDEVGVADAMSVAATIFVSLVVGYVTQKGADLSKPINVDGGDQRDITIHPPKA
jgi:hypothetical protein